MTVIYFYSILVFFSYYGLVLLSDKKLLFRAFVPVFIIFSLILRLNVNFAANADFYGYQSLQEEIYDFKITSILSEPYFPLLNLVLKLIVGSDEVLYIIYYINFIISTSFFVWFASRTNIKLWIKITLFSFEYFLITYTTIRNSVAYILFGILIYEILQNRKFYAGYLGFISHISALPAILATLLGFEKPTVKKIFLVLCAALSFSFVLNLPVFNFINSKFDIYANVDPESGIGQSNTHKIYFAFIVSLTLLLYKISRETVFNTFYIGIFAMYISLFFVSPVMAFRFSLYIIIYLCLYPLYRKSKLDKTLNLLSLLLIFMFIKSFFDSHPDINLLQ